MKAIFKGGGAQCWNCFLQILGWFGGSVSRRLQEMSFGRVLTSVLLLGVLQAAGQNAMQGPLEEVYRKWRNAMVTKNLSGWQQVTSRHRQVAVRNRIFSERKSLASMFSLPAAPPDLRGLTLAKLNVRGPTAKAVYFGTIDFGVGGQPTDNLLVLSFLQDGGWKYDGAEFINLSGLPEVRQALAKGERSSLNKAEFEPTGTRPAISPVQLTGPVKYIAKAYCYCPNREVTMQVNRMSRHSFANTKEAQVVIGGAKDGENLVEFKVKNLPGGNGNEPLAIRVYLLSEKPGVKIPAIFNYEVQEAGVVQTSGNGKFVVTPELGMQLGR